MQLKPDDPAQTKNSAVAQVKKISSADVLMAAAIGLLALPAQAENAPEGTTVAFKYLDYIDYQSTDGTPTNTRGGDRMRVKAPSLGISMGLGESWGVEAAAVIDSVSGASPQYHSTLSGASGKGIKDTRTAIDAKATHYLRRSSIGVGIANSSEDDYKSTAISVDYRMSSEDNNTTFAIGTGYTSDKIEDTNGNVLATFGAEQKKRANDFMLGVTHNLSPTDIVQSNITYSAGKGYYDDPYKTFDKRPDNRQDLAWLTRYNHYFSDADAALHLSYRFFSNSWGMRSHTIESEWHQELGGGWKIIPGLRFYSQNSADFYNDLNPVDVAASFGVPYAQRPLNSFDARLAAFGAITPGVKLVWEISKAVTVDVKAELYEQRASYRVGGEGSPNNEPLKARFLQFGAAWHF